MLSIDGDIKNPEKGKIGKHKLNENRGKRSSRRKEEKQRIKNLSVDQENKLRIYHGGSLTTTKQESIFRNCRMKTSEARQRLGSQISIT